MVHWGFVEMVYTTDILENLQPSLGPMRHFHQSWFDFSTTLRLGVRKQEFKHSDEDYFMLSEQRLERCEAENLLHDDPCVKTESVLGGLLRRQRVLCALVCDGEGAFEGK